MTTAVANPSPDAPTPMPRQGISQLQPFNRHRFADCLQYLSAKHGRFLTLYEAVKLHVMTDVFHAVKTGKPMIGGFISPFPNGPVVRSAEIQFNEWGNAYNLTGETPTGFAAGESQHGVVFRGSTTPDLDDLSEVEIAAMDAAWDAVIPVLDSSWEGSQDFFHRASFIGRAWKVARNLGTPLDWNTILAEYDRERNTSVATQYEGLLGI